MSVYIFINAFFFFLLCFSDQKPLSVEVGEASTLRLLGAEQENAELKRRLEELQTQQEVRVFTLRAGIVCNGLTSNPSLLGCFPRQFENALLKHCSNSLKAWQAWCKYQFPVFINSPAECKSPPVSVHN